MLIPAWWWPGRRRRKSRRSVRPQDPPSLDPAGWQKIPSPRIARDFHVTERIGEAALESRRLQTCGESQYKLTPCSLISICE
jgi:hypothetical protein